MYYKQMRPLPLLVRIPMPIEQVSEDLSFNLLLLYCLTPLCIAGGFFLQGSHTFRIHIRLEQNVFPIRRPQLAISLGCEVREPMLIGHRSRRAIKISNPDLGTILFGGNEREPLAIRRPTRPVCILIGNNLLLPTLGHS